MSSSSSSSSSSVSSLATRFYEGLSLSEALAHARRLSGGNGATATATTTARTHKRKECDVEEDDDTFDTSSSSAKRVKTEKVTLDTFDECWKWFLTRAPYNAMAAATFNELLYTVHDPCGWRRHTARPSRHGLMLRWQACENQCRRSSVEFMSMVRLTYHAQQKQRLETGAVAAVTRARRAEFKETWTAIMKWLSDSPSALLKPKLAVEIVPYDAYLMTVFTGCVLRMHCYVDSTNARPDRLPTDALGGELSLNGSLDYSNARWCNAETGESIPRLQKCDDGSEDTVKQTFSVQKFTHSQELMVVSKSKSSLESRMWEPVGFQCNTFLRRDYSTLPYFAPNTRGLFVPNGLLHLSAMYDESKTQTVGRATVNVFGGYCRYYITSVIVPQLVERVPFFTVGPLCEIVWQYMNVDYTKYEDLHPRPS